MIQFCTERDMEDYFFEHYESYWDSFGIEPELKWKAERQVQIGQHGICDLLFTAIERLDNGIDVLHIRLVELKNTAISHSHVSQVARYADFFNRLESEGAAITNFKASLVGLKTFPCSSDLVFLCQSIGWLDVFEVSLTPTRGLALKAVSDWRPSQHRNDDLSKFVERCGMVPLEGASNGEG